MTRIACVLRSGGDYRPEHVLRLRDQVLAAKPDADFVCLSDVVIEGVATISLAFTWPGWWAKMELFRPDLRGDLLYLDLDTSVVGPIEEFVAIGRFAIMADVYRKGGLQSSVMFLPAAMRGAVWQQWIADPQKWMRRHRLGGDQAFLEQVLDRRQVTRWQDALPGRIASFKAEVRARGLGPATRMVVFHGKPRPWEVGW